MKLFSLINQAKSIGSYALANLAFAVLIDVALDNEKSLSLEWEGDSKDSNDYYYDLLVITDGLRSACIPAPLLKSPKRFRSICNRETEKRWHQRRGVILGGDIKKEAEKILNEILKAFPDAYVMHAKYLDKPLPLIGEITQEIRNAQIEIKSNSARQIIAKDFLTRKEIIIWKGGNDFHAIDWATGDWTLQHSTNRYGDYINEYGLVFQNPNWAWHWVEKLKCLEKGVDRLLIGKGSGNSHSYQIWEVQNPSAVPCGETKRPHNDKQLQREFSSLVGLSYGKFKKFQLEDVEKFGGKIIESLASKNSERFLVLKNKKLDVVINQG